MFARRRADELIVHNRHVRELMLRHLNGENNISIIPHIQIGQGSSACAGQTEKNLILFFGRMWRYKGLELVNFCMGWRLISRTSSPCGAFFPAFPWQKLSGSRPSLRFVPPPIFFSLPAPSDFSPDFPPSRFTPSFCSP